MTRIPKPISGTTIFRTLTLLAALTLFSVGSTVQAATWSLADDFSLAPAANTTTSTWSYGLNNTSVFPVDMALFTTNTRTAVELWGTAFATSPTMWSDASGFWGIGRNDTGVQQVGGAVTWNPGEVMLHPKAGFPGRLVISWLAPVTTTVDIAFAYSSATGSGDGVGIQIEQYDGVTTTTHFGFQESTMTGAPAVPTPRSHTIPNISVTAGDRLYFEYDVWPSAGGDITLASIEITDLNPIPEPTSFALAALGLVGLGWFGCRRRR